MGRLQLKLADSTKSTRTAEATFDSIFSGSCTSFDTRTMKPALGVFWVSLTLHLHLERHWNNEYIRFGISNDSLSISKWKIDWRTILCYRNWITKLHTGPIVRFPFRSVPLKAQLPYGIVFPIERRQSTTICLRIPCDRGNSVVEVSYVFLLCFPSKQYNQINYAVLIHRNL